jgi:hypothetical protein
LLRFARNDDGGRVNLKTACSKFEPAHEIDVMFGGGNVLVAGSIKLTHG